MLEGGEIKRAILNRTISCKWADLSIRVRFNPSLFISHIIDIMERGWALQVTLVHANQLQFVLFLYADDDHVKIQSEILMINWKVSFRSEHSVICNLRLYSFLGYV